MMTSTARVSATLIAAHATATSAAGISTSQTGPGSSTYGGGKNAQTRPAGTIVSMRPVQAMPLAVASRSPSVGWLRSAHRLASSWTIVPITP